VSSCSRVLRVSASTGLFVVLDHRDGEDWEGRLYSASGKFEDNEAGIFFLTVLVQAHSGLLLIAVVVVMMMMTMMMTATTTMIKSSKYN